MQRIVSVGECMIELSGRKDTTWRQGYAGDTLNALWYMRALLPPHVATDYLSAFGDDPFSRELAGFLKANGIGTASSPVIPGKAPGLYAITLDAAGERSFTYWRSDSAARRLADDYDALAGSLAEAGLVYFSGITLAVLDEHGRRNLLTAIENVRGEAAIAFDPNYRPRLWQDAQTARDAIDHACGIASIVLPTFDDEKALFGDADASATAHRVAALGAGEIVVKRGGDPACVATGGHFVEVAPHADVTAVDTTGAGDSFNGAYLAARMTGHEAVVAAEFAHGVSARVIGHHGALMPMAQLAAQRHSLEKR